MTRPLISPCATAARDIGSSASDATNACTALLVARLRTYRLWARRFILDLPSYCSLPLPRPPGKSFVPTSHESRVTSHESRVTSHESRVTNHVFGSTAY